MLAISNIKENPRLPINIWLKEDNLSEAYIGLVDYDLKAITATSKKIKRSFTVRKALIGIFLVPVLLLLIISGLFLYVLAIPCWLIYFRYLNKKIHALKAKLENDISTKKISVEKLKKNHKNTVNVLNTLISKLDDKLSGEKIIRPTIEKIINSIKEVELIERVAAYPEDNKDIVLTFDEMKELNELTDLSV